ncbi:O-antigen ligase family protein [Pseudomaricurvus sp. HS19]|uniref:O-antigen ligase family protein n=1 Tax=Pseudomaricurvus sp. HS19 TaxID=2692626 RepID=UPI0013714060|nr:hypothetical protein [Pseudomaricurvus sp. HS19]
MPAASYPNISLTSDRFVYALFLGLLVWLPMPLGSNRPWAWHLLELITFGLCAWWVALHWRGSVTAPTALREGRTAVMCLLLFAGVMLLQLLPLPVELIALLRPFDAQLETGSWAPVSVDTQTTWMHARTTLAFTALAFLTLALIRTPGRLRALALALLISGTLQAVYGSLMTLSGSEYGFFIKKQHYLGNATGTFVNRNHLANYLILCIAAGTGLLLSDLYQRSAKSWQESGRRLLDTLLGSKVRVRIALAMMVIALVLTRSRMGNTAFFFSLLATGFIWLWLTRRITRGSIILLISLVVIDSLIVGAWFGFDKVAERLEGTAFTKETRDEVNRDTWTLIKDQPLLGSGAGTYFEVFPRYRQQDIPIYYDHAHNDYFQFVVEHGVLGCLPLLAFILLSVRQAIATMRQRKTLQFQAMAFAPVMVVIALLLHSTVDFSLQIPANAATVVVLMTLAWVVRYMPRMKQSRS